VPGSSREIVSDGFSAVTVNVGIRVKVGGIAVGVRVGEVNWGAQAVNKTVSRIILALIVADGKENIKRMKIS